MKPAAPSLFALVRDSGELVVKVVPLDASTQKSVSELFFEQRALLANRTEVAYEPSYKVSDDEVFAATFDLPEDMVSALENPDTCHALDEADVVAESIVCLVLAWKHKGSIEALFQHVERAQVLTRKRFLVFAREKTFSHPDGGGISLGTKLDAAWSDGVLRFTSEAIVKRFLDLSALFQLATDEDVVSFFESDVFAVTSLAMSEVNRGMRMRIKQILDSRILEKYSPDQIKSLATKYDVKVVVKGGKIIVPEAKKDLRDLIAFLAEDYFEGDLSQSRFVTNSKRLV